MRAPALRVAAFVVALVVPVSVDARQVTVMTRNLYLGADLTPAIAAPDVTSLAVAASEIWEVVQATNFPDRARALAEEIARTRPDLIGLQEVALWRTGVPDGPPLLGGTPAKTVVYDFLALLLEALEAEGEDYDVVEVQKEADLESITASGFDIRLTQRDVILVRSDFADKPFVTLSNEQSENYENNLVLPLAGGLAFVASTRGWTSVDVSLDKQGKREFRFINTHLEAFQPIIRALQAGELIEPGGPADTSLPVVLVGDLNSDPNEPTPASLAIDVLLDAGFADTWTLANRRNPGLTCCFSETLLDEDASVFTSRIDYVLVLGADRVLRAERVGIDPSNLSPEDGLWPSDHAGVVVSLLFTP